MVMGTPSSRASRHPSMIEPTPPTAPGSAKPPLPARRASSSPTAEAKAPSSPSSSVHLGSRNPFASPTSSTKARDAPGSSRTRVYASPSQQSTTTLLSPSTSFNPFVSSSASAQGEPSNDPHVQPDDDGVSVTVGAPVDLEDEAMPLDNDAPHSAYRSPEPVIEPPDDPGPGYIIAEHPPWDEDVMDSSAPSRRQKANTPAPEADDELMQVDDATTPAPQYGLPGIMPRKFLASVHDHVVYQPVITAAPPPLEKKAHARQASTASSAPSSPEVSKESAWGAPSSPAPTPAPSTPEPGFVATLSDIWNALPGGEEHHHEWYFCPTCWGWIRIAAGSDEPRDDYNRETREPYHVQTAVQDSSRDFAQFLYLKETLADEFLKGEGEHLHPFPKDSEKLDKVERIDRIQVDEEVNAFPHLTIPGLDVPDSWSKFGPSPSASKKPVLYLSSLSNLWVDTDGVVVPGQIPVALVNEFTSEKMSNPRPGMRGAECVSEAWSLLSTLLLNPLFRSQWGWVQLENSKFKRMIGTSAASSSMLYHIGFGCRQENDVLRIGPFLPNERISKEQARQMTNYMLRAWVEIGIFLPIYQARNEITPIGEQWITPSPLEDVLHDRLSLARYPKLSSPIPDRFKGSCESLGVTKWDVCETIEQAYTLQIISDRFNLKTYLGALEELAQAPIFGKEALHMKVATERSLGRYTDSELRSAYNLIGYTTTHASEIDVEPEDAPAEYILDLHKRAVQTASSPTDRAAIDQALVLIGKSRKDFGMIRLGQSGQTHMTVDEAYNALSAPRDSIDDGLIMQYEMAVADFPGKADHYKRCLGIIADAPGEERPGIRSYLETGYRIPPAPPRRDVPVGLQNIGNTCYLNSILQYLYSIKPVREAVLSFEQGEKTDRTPLKPEVERSRRFVKHLRLLFLQLYKSEMSSVRPEEDLAYLAITRPEVDEIVEPSQIEEPEELKRKSSILDSIPDIPDIPDAPSPASTAVASDFTSTPTIANSSRPESPRPGDIERPASVLGKRQSEDRDESASPASAAERTRMKSEVTEGTEGTEATEGTEGMDVDVSDLQGSDPKILPEIDTTSPVKDMSALHLKSPEIEPSVPPPLPPRPAPQKKPTLASGLQFGLQQDSAEVLINVLTQLEMAFDPLTAEGEARQPNLISDLFSCKYRQQTSYETADGDLEARTPVESVFVHPIIGVEEEGKDLYDCLGELYLRGDEIEYEGRKGYMMDLMDSFPPMLYIQMRRSQYDPKTGRETKTNTHIPFDQTLAMDRFLATADKACREESIEITREISRIRERLHALRNHKPLSIPDTFDQVRDALGHLVEENILAAGGDVTADLMQSLEDEGKAVRAEIDSLESKLPLLRAKLDSLWEGQREYEYELVSVFMHRGRNSGSGHYWTFQSHLPDKPEEFFKYNDEEVTAVPASEVLQDRTGSDANPALLCYVRKGKGIVETLHREILELQEVVEADDDEPAKTVSGQVKDGEAGGTSKDDADDVQVEVLDDKPEAGARLEDVAAVKPEVQAPKAGEADLLDMSDVDAAGQAKTVEAVETVDDGRAKDPAKDPAKDQTKEQTTLDKNQGVDDLMDAE